jgi:hypothetical protein
MYVVHKVAYMYCRGAARGLPYKDQTGDNDSVFRMFVPYGTANRNYSYIY